MPSKDPDQPKQSLVTALARRTSRWVTDAPQGWKATMVFWLARRLPHCKQVAPLLSEAVDHELPLPTRIKVKLHLIVCLACVRYEQQLRFLTEIASGLAAGMEEHPSPSAGLSDEARERLKRSLSGRE